MIYGLFIGYAQSSFTSMSNDPTGNYYYYASDTTNLAKLNINSTTSPFPQFVVALAMILLIVGK